jgi:hypothetical protein
MKATKPKTRFKLTTFENRGGSISYRIAGTKSNGERVGENFLDVHAAQCRQAVLMMPIQVSLCRTWKNITSDILRAFWTWSGFTG